MPRTRNDTPFVTGMRGHRVRNIDKRIARRQQILLALAEVLAVKGYEDATLDDVAARMNCSKAVIYYQFKSKADVFVALVEQVNRDAIARLREIASTDASPEAQLRAAIDSLVRFGWQPLDYASIRVRRPSSLPREARIYLRALDREYEDIFTDIVRRGMDTGAVARRNPRFVALTLINAVLSVFRWARPGGALSPDDLQREIPAMLLNGVLTPGGSRAEDGR
ncbi:MAG: TetR/AcrR family transcriptional regulator [Dehalococcoidia bacterium]|nr:TetR/AcrR family transcriptional regulator [Dehalococcoidia bacterium]